MPFGLNAFLFASPFTDDRVKRFESRWFAASKELCYDGGRGLPRSIMSWDT
jgi:hypothetical protein